MNCKIICTIASIFLVSYTNICSFACYKIRCLCNDAYLYCSVGIGQRYSHHIISVYAYSRYVHIEESLISNSTGAHIWWHSNFSNCVHTTQSERKYVADSQNVGRQICYLFLFDISFYLFFCKCTTALHRRRLGYLHRSISARVPQRSLAMQESKPNLLGYWQACCTNHLALNLQYIFAKLFVIRREGG